MTDFQQQLQELVRQVQKLGADAADALLVDGVSKSVSWRQGACETLEHAEGRELGLRAFFGQRQAMASTTDLSPAALRELAQRVVDMAQSVPEDPCCGLAAPDEITTSYPALALADDYSLSMEDLKRAAQVAEESALAVEGVTQCEGAHAGGDSTSLVLVASNGFTGSYKKTSYAVSVSALAGQGTAMERDYDYDSKLFLSDLAAAQEIGRTAGERAVRRLGARKMPSGAFPVVFDPREARKVLGHFVGAIVGTGIARGTSFLKESMGTCLFPDTITIVDDPLRARGLRSKAFDAEGMATKKRTIVDKGVLQTWLLDLRSARQLGLSSTGHASRGVSSMPSPSPTNIYIEAGDKTPGELMAPIKSGFYVTETMGMGVNGVTGDFSQAASGFWIEQGQIAYPVNEMTIAGNLKTMFAHIQAANDLKFRYGIDSPTLMIEQMSVAGL